MSGKRNSSVDKFSSKLKDVQPVEIDTKVFYRDAAATGYTEYRTGVLFGTAGGGRYSPPEKYPVLYFSADPLGCALEVAHHARLLTPHQNVSQVVTQIHRDVSDIEAIQSALKEANENDQEAILKDIATKYDFLKPSFDEDPQLLKLYLVAPVPLAHETIPVIPIGGTRINVPIILTAKVVNLLDENVLATIGISREELVVPTQAWKEAQTSGNWTVCQNLGRAAYLDKRFDGILFPSAIPADEMSSLVRMQFNLALFMQTDDRAKLRGKTAAYSVSDNFTRVCDVVFGPEIARLLVEINVLQKQIPGK